MNVNSANPFTRVTAADAYRQSKGGHISSRTHEVAKVWLWAIRIKAEVQSFLTKPVVLISASALMLATTLLFPPATLGMAIVSLIVMIASSSIFSFGVILTIKGDLPKLSDHYAQIANLAKQEINQRQMRVQPQDNNPFAQKV